MFRKHGRRFLWVFLFFGIVGGSVFAGIWYLRKPHQPDHVLADEAQLDPEERKYLWDVEHHGNILSQKGFKAIATALSAASPDQLAALLDPAFQGRIAEKAIENKLEREILTVVQRQTQDDAYRQVDRDEFVKHLMTFRNLFSGTTKVGMNLMQLSPEKRGDLESLWHGSCLLRLAGFWQNGKPAEVVLTMEYELTKPSEENIKKGSWLRKCTVVQSLVGKADKFLFSEVAGQRGLKPEMFHDNWKSTTFVPQTGSVHLCDFDRDGWMDILVLDMGQIRLFRNVGGAKFEDVTERMNLPTGQLKTSLAAWVDLDGDGWVDLIIGNHVLRNDHGKTFEDYSHRCNLPLGSGGSVVVADFNGDGLMDLYICHPGEGKADSSWLTGKAGGLTQNYLLMNEGMKNGKLMFRDATQEWKADGGNRSCFTAVCLDVNNDGRPDIYAINEFGDGVLLVNEGSHFSSRLLYADTNEFGAMGAAAGDIDNDGNIDLYIASMYSKAGKRVIGNLRPDTYTPDLMRRFHNFVKGNHLHRNLGGFKFDDLGEKMQINAAGWAYGTALLDLDNDGFLDIYCTAGFVSKDRKKPDG